MIKAEWTNKDSLDLQPTCNQLATTEGYLINRADAINCIKWGEGVTDVIGRIKALPSADAVELVRCKDCRWWNGNSETMHNNHLCRNWSKFGSINTSADDFCSYGERREP